MTQQRSTERAGAMEAATAEYFAPYYTSRLAHAALPLAVIHQRYDDGMDTGLHQHMDFYALYVVEGGRGAHVINGRPYAVKRGDVYLTPPGAIHAYRAFSGLRAEAFCFQPHLLTAEMLEALAATSSFWTLFLPPGAPLDAEARDTPDAYQLHLSPESRQAVEAMAGEVIAELEAPSADPAFVPLARGLFFRLLVHLARLRAASDAERRGARDAQEGTARGMALAEVLRVCEARFAEPLTIGELAALMFLSPGHFTEVFTREIGMPPHAYLRRLRLERAQTLLRATDLAATEIAHAVGFSDLAQLSRAFRASFGMTMTDYRSRFRRPAAR